MEIISKHKKSNTYCCVPQCKSLARKCTDISFHRFPREVNARVPSSKNIRQRWIQVLKIGKKVSNRMVVCSQHFREEDFLNRNQPRKSPRLKTGAIPSRNLPLASMDNAEKIKRRKCKALERMERRTNRELQIQTERNVVSCKPPESSKDGSDPDFDETAIQSSELEVAEALLLLNEASNSLSLVKDFSTQTDLSNSSKDASVQVNVSNRLNIFFTDNNLKSIAGIPSVQLLNKLSELVEASRKFDNRKLFTTKEEVVLTMMRIKMNITFSALSCFWKCTSTTCKNIFAATVKDLSTILQSCIKWASKEEILSNIPKQFKNFSPVRVILDCTEIKISKPKCLRCQIATYSHYKKAHTIKYLVSISPGGTIMNVSNGYGGRVSDKFIFIQSDILSMLEPHIDSIMVDKGFLIDKECNDAFISIVRPPFMKNKRYTVGQCNSSKTIAGVRVHVERAIQRMKIFGATQDKLNYSLLEYMDYIMIIVCALANLNGCIFSDVRF